MDDIWLSSDSVPDPLPQGYFRGGELGVDFSYDEVSLKRLRACAGEHGLTDECIDALQAMAVFALSNQITSSRPRPNKGTFRAILRDGVAFGRTLAGAKSQLPEHIREHANALFADLNAILKFAHLRVNSSDGDRRPAFKQTTHLLYRSVMGVWEALTQQSLPPSGGDEDASHIRFIKAAVDPVLTSLGLRTASGDAIRKRISAMVREREKCADLLDEYDFSDD
ncbi:MAG: hypothetical protein P4L82_21235 [Ancalomicrobiaceae bacterium]|nr:hypothetical protein [Ancalomicrobiaceae bacterium]